MKWLWRFIKPHPARPATPPAPVKNGTSDISRRDAQRKLRDAIRDRVEVKEVIKESRRLTDQFGDILEQTMRRSNG
jgi:hypothetical protein